MKSRASKGIKISYALLIYIFLYLPIIVLIAFSFNKSRLNAVWTGFTFKWYKMLLHNYGIIDAMKNTLIVAVVSTFVSVIIGTMAAVGMYKYKFKGKTVLDGMLYIPIVIPEIVVGIASLAFFSQIMHMQLGLVTLIIAHITFSISYVVVVVRARLEGFDRSLEDAAMDLGANSWKTFTEVTLPIITPGIVAGGLLAFTLSLDDVIISFFVAGPQSTTLPIKVFSMVKFGVSPEINALSTIMIAITLSVVIFAERMKSQTLKKSKIIAILCVFAVVISGFSYGLWAAGKNAKSYSGELNVFNWSEYLPQSIIDKFQEEYNIKINYSTYASNEEMLAKLMASRGEYDLSVSSDYMVEVMKKQNLIQPIDKASVPNLANIGAQFKNLYFDKGNKYTVPYMWGNAVIAYNKKLVKTKITGYSDLWKPEFKNSMVVLDDQRAIIGMALKKNGYSINDTSKAALDTAKADLLKLRPNIKAYDSDSPKTLLINGEAKVGYVWGAEASLAHRENKDIEAVLPKEGMYLWQDNFVIPKGARNKKNAELFINFLLEPEISAEISKSFPYANPNVKAYKYMDKASLEEKAVYPPQSEISKGEHLRDIGDRIKLFDSIWTELKN